MHIARWQAWVRFYRMQRAPGFFPVGMFVVAILLLLGGGFAQADVAGTPPAQAAQTQIPLTETERAWVREHPGIRVDNETEWPPINFAEDGEPRGYSIDFMNLVAQRIGLQVHYVTGPPRSAFVPMLRRGELDVGLNIIRTPERTQEFLFTPPYLRIAPVILSRKGQAYSSLEQLAGKTIVIPDGFFYQEFVRRNFPQIEIVPAANTEAAIEAVAGQKADAALGERAVLSYLVGHEKVEGLVISPELDLLDPELALARMATRKDNPILAGLLTKAIDSIGLEDRRALERKWLGNQPAVAGQWARAELSDAEMVWLEQHPRMRLGVNPNYPPFDFVDEKGVFSGVSADYVDLIAKRLGIAMTVVPDLTWTEAVDGIRAGRVDMVAGIKQTEDRRQFLDFTPDYLTFPMVIMTREAHPMIVGLTDLRGRTVALGQGYAVDQEIARRYPDIKQRLFGTLADALVAVKRGEADATVLNLGTASYLIAKHSISGLVVAAPAGLEDARSAFGIRKDWPELGAIMDKVLASITPQEEAAIRSKWITAPYDERQATEDARRLAFQVAGAAGVVILAFLLWNYRLKRQVRERRRAEEIVAAKEAELRDMFERSPISVIITNPEGAVRYANSSWLRLFDISRDELAEFRAENLHFDPDQRERFVRSIQQSGSLRDVEFTVKRSDGRPIHVLLSADLYNYRGETCFVSWFSDITERKATEQALADAERLLRDMANSVPGAVFQLRVTADGSRVYTFISDGVLELSGIAAPEARRDYDILWRLVFDEDKQPFEQAIIVAISTVNPITHDFRIRRPDGGVRWMQVRAAPRAEPDGAIIFNGYWVDMTQQREMEQALAEAERQLRDTANSVPGAVFQLHVATNGGRAYTFMGDGILELTGVTAEEARRDYHALRPFIFDDDKLLLDQAYANAIATLETMTHDFRVYRQDGSVGWIEVRAVPRREADGSTVFNGYWVDVTQQRETEQALAEAERQLRDTTDNIPGTVFQLRITQDGRRSYTFVSAGLRELAGISAAEVLRDGGAFWRLVFEEDKPSMENAIGVAVSTLTTVTHDFRIRRPEGTVRWIKTSAVPRAEPDASVIFNGYWVDVTQQRETEQALAEAERQLRDTTDNIPGAVFQARITQDGRRSFEFASRGLVEIAGITAPELLRDNDALLRLIFDEEDKLSFNRANRIAISTLSTITHDFRIRRPDGAIRWVNTRAVPRREPDGSTLFSGYWVDVTQQHEMEEALARAKAAADAANEAKSTFLASMSHEIRTPMNGVLGMLELLGLSQLDNEQRQRLDVVRDSSHSLLRIIDDILDFSKIEAGRLDLSPVATSLAQLVDGVRDIYLGAASRKNLLLTASVDPRISAAVTVDPLRLRQILNNLVSNAIKFTTQGSVAIAAELIEHKDAIDTVRFAVTDTGIGISPEDQEHLFQPFVQAEISTSRRFGGTGLGLTISRRIAEMMNGTITMESRLGHGTTMQLVVPFPIADPDDIGRDEEASPLNAAALAARRAAPSNEEAAREGTLVLIADDHSTNRLTVRSQLNLLGYASEAVEDGRRALELWQSGRFGLVITDCHMPEMDGYDLARAIRRLEADNGGGRMPVIACTANAMAGEAEACLAAGMDDYLAKPVELRPLLGILDRWLPLPDGPSRSPRAEPPGPAASRSRATAESVPLDHSRLAQLSGGDGSVEREILADFRSAVDDDAAEMAAALADADCRAMARVSHRMKGASLMVGALPLAAICAQMEAASGADDHAAIAAHRATLLREIERLKHYLTEISGEPSLPSSVE